MNSKKPDFKHVAGAALSSINQVLAHWLPGGKREGKEYISVNPIRADQKAGSFSVNLNNGIWSDFATGDKGGDLIGLVAYLEGVSQGQARDQLAQFLGLDDAVNPRSKAPPTTQCKVDEWEPITPVPENAPQPLTSHYRHGSYALFWDYRDEAGQMLCRVCRFEKGNGHKEIMPLSYCQASDGKRAWRWKGLPAPRPLYNLNTLSDRTDAPVIVVEGEKSAVAAAQLFPDCVITTMLNGSQAPHKTDWAPLNNRRVYLWPDNDKAGRGCMDKVSGLVESDQAFTLNLKFFETLPTGEKRSLPEKWDAADAIEEGFTAEQCSLFFENKVNFIPARVKQGKQRKGVQLDQNLNQVSHYQLIEDDDNLAPGVYYFGHDRNGEPMPPLWICSPLKITAHTRNANNEAWGFLLEFKDRDGKLHIWAMPSEMTSGSGEEYRKILLDGGLAIAPGTHARNHLTSYILTQKTDARTRCVESTGWHDRLYVLPDCTLGESEERVIYQTTHGLVNTFKQTGTLEDWQENVSRLCRGNSRLIFAVSASFAGMLIGLVDCDSFGFHFRGDSSTGKTTALRVAASVFGGKEYMQRWRTTDNALESLASQHCDAALILDELAQIDPKAAGDVAYMLANGGGKSRANRNGTARQRIVWRLVYLSAGEISLAEHIAQIGKRIRAGQEVRLIDVPVDAGAGFGMFEALHGHPNGAAFSRELNRVVGEYYGCAALCFIEQIQHHLDQIPGIVNAGRTAFTEQHVPEGASGQVERAAKQFALVGAAGELATRFGITGWSEGDAEQSARICFDAWIQNRGGVGNQEQSAMLAQFEQFFQLHGEARFTDWDRANDSHAPRTMNRAGYRRTSADGEQSTYYVFNEVFRKEICEGFDARAMTAYLVEQGHITPDTDGKSSRGVRLPGIGMKRVYCVNWGWEYDET